MTIIERKPAPAGSDVRPTSFRVKRFERIAAMIGDVAARKGRVEILDVGGTYGYWLGLEPLWEQWNVRVTLVNLAVEPVRDRRFVSRAGDACDLSEFADGSFDIVHSNSVIEHVGRWGAMRKMAAEVSRLAPRFYVQTPAFAFPIEPHFRAPFVHWLPTQWRAGLTHRFMLGAYPRSRTVDEAMRTVEDAILLDERQMRALFPPPARIEKERLLGLTKSYIAIRD